MNKLINSLPYTLDMKGRSTMYGNRRDDQVLHTRSEVSSFAHCSYKIVVGKQELNVNELYEIK